MNSVKMKPVPKKKRKQKTAFPRKTVYEELDISPMPGRYFIRLLPDHLIREKKLKFIEESIGVNDKVTLEEFERRLYDDPRTAVIIAVGPNFVRGDIEEEMLFEKLDLVILDQRDRSFPHLLYKGALMFIVSQPDIITKTGELEDFSVYSE